MVNPKGVAAASKASMAHVPLGVILEVGVGMSEGASKYGRFNFRDSKVAASDYIAAMFRHITAWQEGEDIDTESGLSHVTKAICTLVVLRDAEATGQLIDDRPRPLRVGVVAELNDISARIK